MGGPSETEGGHPHDPHAGVRFHGGMTTQVPRTLTLLLDGAPSGPLTGTVVDEHGRRRPFEGWLGLAEALEAHLAVGTATSTATTTSTISAEPLETGSAR